MPLKSRLQHLLFALMSCVLAVVIPSAPVMTSWVQEEVRSETSDPVEDGSTEDLDEATVSQVRNESRRSRRSVSEFSSSSGQKTLVRSKLIVTEPVSGEGSRIGRSTPLHC